MIRSWIDELSLEAKLGQLLLVGFEGTEFSPQLREFFEKYRPGGVILFERNFISKQQLTKLCADLQEWAASQSPPIPLFISTDHEGGRVQRFKRDFTILPPPGNISSPEEAYQVGKTMGVELEAVGVNMNFAPLLDVNSNPDNPIIGDRSFGNDPERVIQLALALMQGLQEEGVIAVGKHFPGHGNTSEDSHKTLPIVADPQETLRKRELAPFRAAFAAGLPALMSAHVLYPAWDELNPATCSPLILNDLLRQELGFAGVLISDDLLMGALKGDDIGLTAGKALRAGIDLLLIGAQPEAQIQALNYLRNACQNGTLNITCLNASLHRLLKLKARHLGRRIG